MEITYKGQFRYGFACVQREDNLWNFIDKNGKLFSPRQWFKWVDNFYEGIARVQYDCFAWNFVTIKGDIMLPNQMFYQTRRFHNGLAPVKNIDTKWGLINTNGKFVTDMEFDNIWYHGYYYLATMNSHCYYFDSKCRKHKLLL